MSGQEAIMGAYGPMGRSVRDMNLFMKVVLAVEPWKIDPTQVAMPWRIEEPTWRGGATTPTIGVMWDDGVVLPHLPIARALKYAVEKLRVAGFTVVEYKAYSSKEAWDIIVSAWGCLLVSERNLLRALERLTESRASYILPTAASG